MRGLLIRAAAAAAALSAAARAGDASESVGRVLSLSTVVRYWTVETTRNGHILGNESSVHTVAACTAFRAAVAAGWPGASISWAFSFDALTAQDGDYPAIRRLVAGYVSSLGDEMTFNPGGYFAPMYNNESQTNADVHDALALIAGVVGGGFKCNSRAPPTPILRASLCPCCPGGIG